MDIVKSFFFNRGGDHLFSTLVGDSSFSNTCIIYLAPLFEERMWTQRIAFNFAIDLWNKENYAVCIFDYYGYGESDGDSEDFSLLRCREDIKVLLEILKRDYGFNRFVLWGIRLGCLIAIDIVSENPNISSLIFWAPIINLKDFIYKSMRSTITSQSSLFKKVLVKREEIIAELMEYGKCERRGYLLNNIDGYRFGRLFYEEILQLNFNDILNKVNCPLFLIIDIATVADTTVRSKFENKQENVFHSIEKLIYERVIEKPIWDNNPDYSQRSEEVYRITAKWCKNYIGKK